MKNAIIILSIVLSPHLVAQEGIPMRAPAVQEDIPELKGAIRVVETVEHDELIELKKLHEKALERGNLKEAQDFERAFYLSAIKYLKQKNSEKKNYSDEDSTESSKQIVSLKKSLAACESGRQPATINTSNRSFLEEVRKIFNFDRKGPPAPVEDRTIPK